MTVSLVEVSPSTEMRLNECSTASSTQACSVGLVDARVGRDEAKHRGHVGMDHARALGHAADRDLAAVDLEAHGVFLAPRVGGHDRLGRFDAAFRRQVSPRPCRCPCALSAIGSRLPMRPVEQTSHSRGLVFVILRGVLDHRLGIGDSAHAGAGIGAAGIDHHAANLPVARVPHRDLDRRGLDQIGRERRGDFRRDIRDDQRHVLLAARLDAARDAGGLKALRGGDASSLDDLGFHSLSCQTQSFHRGRRPGWRPEWPAKHCLCQDCRSRKKASAGWCAHRPAPRSESGWNSPPARACGQAAGCEHLHKRLLAIGFPQDVQRSPRRSCRLVSAAPRWSTACRDESAPGGE